MGRLHEILILEQGDRSKLESMLNKGKFQSNEIKRAEILIKSDDGKSVAEIATEVDRCEGTVRNIRNKYIEGGLDMALYDSPRPGAPKKIYSEHEALITAIACSEVPEGHSHWTLRMIGDKMVELTEIQSVNTSTICRVLKKVNSNPGKIFSGVLAR